MKDKFNNFVPSGLDCDCFSVGDTVNVRRQDEHDMFNHGFTGRVIDKNAIYVIVEDQDGDCFSCNPEQLSFNTDDIMHVGGA